MYTLTDALRDARVKHQNAINYGNNIISSTEAMNIWKNSKRHTRLQLAIKVGKVTEKMKWRKHCISIIDKMLWAAI